MQSGVEQRKDQRQEIQLQMEFAPVTAYGAPVTRAGVTRNVSAGGVYFHTDKGSALRAGSKLTIRFAVPGNSEDPGTPLAMTACARVKRVEALDGPSNPDEPLWGVAVMFDHRPTIRMGYDFWLVDE